MGTVTPESQILKSIRTPDHFNVFIGLDELIRACDSGIGKEAVTRSVQQLGTTTALIGYVSNWSVEEARMKIRGQDLPPPHFLVARDGYGGVAVYHRQDQDYQQLGGVPEGTEKPFERVINMLNSGLSLGIGPANESWAARFRAPYLNNLEGQHETLAYRRMEQFLLGAKRLAERVEGK